MPIYFHYRSKEPLFFTRFQEGWLKQCQDKFVYIYQTEFPEEGYTDGKKADAFMRRHLGQTAFNGQRIKGELSNWVLHTRVGQSKLNINPRRESWR